MNQKHQRAEQKHPYAEQIHAFADGKAIQCRKRTIANNAPWEDIAKPSWLPDFEYRVKPEPLATWMDKTMLKKVGELTKANDDLRHELGGKDAEINQLEDIIKCIDNSSIKLSKENREYRQTNADLHNEVEHLKKQNAHLQWGHDTAQAVAEKRKQEVDELQHLLDGCMRDKQAIASHFREKIARFEERLNTYEQMFGNDCVSAPAEAEESADTDAQVFGADVIISIQFPPQEKL